MGVRLYYKSFFFVLNNNNLYLVVTVSYSTNSLISYLRFPNDEQWWLYHKFDDDESKNNCEGTLRNSVDGIFIGAMAGDDGATKKKCFFFIFSYFKQALFVTYTIYGPLYYNIVT